jgi:hypothetical protein
MQTRIEIGKRQCGHSDRRAGRQQDHYHDGLTAHESADAGPSSA